MKEKKIAIITARGGSKRIPRKNIKEFCGKPIIAYSIEAALESEAFDTVMVSTEDAEIAEIAKKYGAEVPFMRSESNAGDYATTADVLLEVLEKYKESGILFDELCCIYPTAPFVTGKRLSEAMELLKAAEVDSVMPVMAFSFPPMRGMYIRNDKLSYCYPEYAMVRSQDIETMYHDCGQFYAVKCDAFMRKRKLVTENTRGIIVPESEVQDIDTIEDWKLAEMKYQLYKEKKDGI